MFQFQSWTFTLNFEVVGREGKSNLLNYIYHHYLHGSSLYNYFSTIVDIIYTINFIICYYTINSQTNVDMTIHCHYDTSTQQTVLSSNLFDKINVIFSIFHFSIFDITPLNLLFITLTIKIWNKISAVKEEMCSNLKYCWSLVPPLIIVIGLIRCFWRVFYDIIQWLVPSIGRMMMAFTIACSL